MRTLHILPLFVLIITFSNASRGQDNQPGRGEPRELPAANFPTTQNSRFCRPGIRKVVVSNQSFEIGDTWAGQIATPAICGVCGFSNAPGSPEPDYQHKISLAASWADGMEDRIDVTSDHLNDSPLLGLTARGIVGKHTYNKEVDPPQNARILMRALCIDDQGQWWEAVDNDCAAPVTSCVQYSATVGVYKSIAPSTTSIVKDVVHGQIARGALSITLIKNAPLSGTKVTITSDNDRVLFPQVGGPSTLTSVVQVPAGQTSANFDIDATLAKAGNTFTVQVKNAALPQPIMTTKYTVK